MDLNLFEEFTIVKKDPFAITVYLHPPPTQFLALSKNKTTEWISHQKHKNLIRNKNDTVNIELAKLVEYLSLKLILTNLSNVQLSQ